PSRHINDEGRAILLGEQDAQRAVQFAHRGYGMETGEIALAGSSAELLQNEKVKKAYLGE
ncbi:MAG: ABC transporter ATP-binding protein, partial [Planctomycetes bacterium]|nr:ABC transporter ATP-binding protein [Planctomycetota bacterium]